MDKKLITTVCLIGVAILSLAGCKEEAKKKTPPPPEVVFDLQKAQKIAQERILSADVEAAPLPVQTDYLRIVAQADTTPAQPDRFLKPITSDKTQTVIILATLHNGPDLTMPDVPLYIFEKKQTSWQQTFAAQGPITPYFVEQRAPLDATLEIVLLKDKLKDLAQDAQKQLDSYLSQHTVYSKEQAHVLSALPDAFAQRIALVEEASLKALTKTDISYLENYASAFSFMSKAGEVTFTTTLAIEGKESLLSQHENQLPSYNDLMTYAIAGQTARQALGDLENSFWSVPGDALRPSCDAINGALQERLGLSLKDSAIVLWGMMQSHALFATDIDYNTQCSGEDINTLLTNMGRTLPQIQSTRPSSQTLTQMNRSLSHVARLVKNTKDSALDQIADMMTDKVLVRDEARLLFSTEPDQLVSNTQDVIAPALDKANAAEYLMMLPVQAYGCYSQGQGQRGYHRATLAQLENDPNLWQIDFAFDDQNKINGIQLKKPSQLDFCRAIGKRTGANRCRFSGKDFPGLSADRCG
ncbi:MAG: hypothetical protein ACNI26_05165 [Terasakiella sp.]|uniref:hypothetical protein n=1 Tax=unclassified Terasakiella TaxID=2614952 RepID=UPI003B0002FD